MDEEMEALYNMFQGTGESADEGTEPAPAEDVPAVEGSETDEAQVGEDPNTPEAAAPAEAPDTNQQKANQAFAQMRVEQKQLREENARYVQSLSQIQQFLGLGSVEETLEALVNQGIQAQAQKQNVPPELLMRMNALEQQNAAMNLKAENDNVLGQFNNLQQTLQLSDQEMTTFVQQLQQNNVDVRHIGVDLVTLYKGMNQDAILQKQLKAKEQEWIANSAAASATAPGVPGKKGTSGTSKATNKIETAGELTSFLAGLEI